MKISHLFFLFALALFTACKDDDGAPAATTLQYDGENNSGPLLVAGEHELAVRFPASALADHVGKELTEVQVFVGNKPQACLVRVYGQGDDTTPGPKLYEADVVNAITTQAWNNFKVTPGIEITGEDLWLGVNIEHATEMQSIGCDAGPRKANGDWLFAGSDLSWLTYQVRSGESVNWNIRGKVE